MATTAVAALLLTLYWVLNYGAKGRLQQIKFLKFLFDPNKAVLPRFNLALLGGAGFGLAQLLSGVVGWFNFPLPWIGVKLFSILMLAGIVLWLLDWVHGPGIKNSSYGVAFGMPIIAASSGGNIAAFILWVSGAINAFAGGAFSSGLA